MIVGRHSVLDSRVDLLPERTARPRGHFGGILGHNAGSGARSWVRLSGVAHSCGGVVELPEATAYAFTRDARRVSNALLAATGVVKLNYEIHGNSLPHRHMHVSLTFHKILRVRGSATACESSFAAAACCCPAFRRTRHLARPSDELPCLCGNRRLLRIHTLSSGGR
jgi:hypothetical protein